MAKEKNTTVRVSCEGVDTIALADVHPLQGDLKVLREENYEKLKANLLRDGFTSPFALWFDEDGKAWTVDGHQRDRTLRKMYEEGYRLPKRFPYVRVLADSREAALRILLTHASQYGDVDRQGLYKFMHDGGIEIGELLESATFPVLNLESFKAEFFTDLEAEAERSHVTDHDRAKPGATEYAADDFQKFKHTCPRCAFGFD